MIAGGAVPGAARKVPLKAEMILAPGTARCESLFSDSRSQGIPVYGRSRPPLAVRASQQEVHEMRRVSERAVFYLALTTIFMLTVSATAHAQGGVTKTGTLADGATYLIEVPANWNGTLFLYSHGYVPPGSPNPARDVGDPFTRFFMLSSGFALAGSSYATTGWAIHEAIPDQIKVLDVFKLMVGDPKRTIAWGHSLGGMVTAALIQTHPGRFDAALPMCGVLSGGVATWNTALDSAFAFKTLLAPGTGLQVVNITNPLNLRLAEDVLLAAQLTAQGWARL